MSPTLVVSVFQEYMDGRSIDTKLWNPTHTEPSSLSWLQKVSWAIDIASGMAHIHDQGFAHRDLKSLNVLCKTTDGEISIAKVTGEHCTLHIVIQVFFTY